MSENSIAAAEAAYASGDFEKAAGLYLDSAREEGASAGAAYHLAGNAFMRLKRYEDAVEAYREAFEDHSYDRETTVLVNLGSALAALGRSEEALDAYDRALEDETYATPHKALQGRAAALYALGRYEEAASAYREAAWVDGNSDPGKALNNLGLSFMAMGKPQEAVDAFKAALSTDSYASKGKAAVNLALAYSEMGFFDEAVSSFDVARDTYGHELRGDTLHAYEVAQAAVAAGGGPALDIPDEDFEAEVVDGWETGEMPAIEARAPRVATDDDEATAKFFNMTEDEMRDADVAARKERRAAERTPKSIAIRVAIVVVAVLVVAGAIAGMLFAGIGYPTQEQTVSGLIDAYRSGEPYTDYWVAVPSADITQAMRALPAKFAAYKITGVDRSAQSSTVRVEVELDTGSVMTYDIKLAREGVGWKVTGVSNSFSSTGGS